MDQIDEVPAEFTQTKNEQCIQIKCKESTRTGSIVLTNSVSHTNTRFIAYLMKIKSGRDESSATRNHHTKSRVCFPGVLRSGSQLSPA